MSYHNESLFERHPIIISIGIVLGVIGFIAFGIYTINIFLSGAGRAPVPFKITVDLLKKNILLDQIERASPKDKKSVEEENNLLSRTDPEIPYMFEYLVDIDGDRSARLMLEKQKLFLKKTLSFILTYMVIIAVALAPFVMFALWVKDRFIKNKTALIIEKNTEKSRTLRKEAEGIFQEAEMLKRDAMMEKQGYIYKRQMLEADLHEEYQEKIINLHRKNKEDLKRQDSRNKKVLQEKNKQIDDLKNKIGAIRALSEKW